MSANTTVLLVLTGHDRLGDTGRSTGFNVPEAAHPWRVFTDAGYGVAIATPGGVSPNPDSADRSDPVQRDFLDDPAVTARLARPLRTDRLDPGDYAAIFYVGGHGTMWDFPNDEHLAAVARDVYEAGGVIAAVCHGPAGLVPVVGSDGRHIVDGKNLTGFTDAEEAAVGLTDVVPFLLASTLTKLGGRHTGAENFAAHVVVDGRLVTGQNPASATGTAEAVVTALAA